MNLKQLLNLSAVLAPIAIFRLNSIDYVAFSSGSITFFEILGWVVIKTGTIRTVINRGNMSCD